MTLGRCPLSNVYSRGIPQTPVDVMNEKSVEPTNLGEVSRGEKLSILGPTQRRTSPSILEYPKTMTRWALFFGVVLVHICAADAENQL